eukprot:TRINITY_DN4361_c0_g2_i3.p1 TRINITY_DN4361_c0_g2~~TRINITY_DN4361_c0_g2_i3.p1  ORF type:complete len:337 (+),score=41.21 TRINITY_DN4361_c0_g2_i3:39-1049(+)
MPYNTNINDLPDDILQIILHHHLTLPHSQRCTAVCTRWRSILHDDLPLWLSYYDSYLLRNSIHPSSLADGGTDTAPPLTASKIKLKLAMAKELIADATLNASCPRPLYRYANYRPANHPEHLLMEQWTRAAWCLVCAPSWYCYYISSRELKLRIWKQITPFLLLLSAIPVFILLWRSPQLILPPLAKLLVRFDGRRTPNRELIPDEFQYWIFSTGGLLWEPWYMFPLLVAVMTVPWSLWLVQQIEIRLGASGLISVWSGGFTFGVMLWIALGAKLRTLMVTAVAAVLCVIGIHINKVNFHVLLLCYCAISYCAISFYFINITDMRVCVAVVCARAF